MSDDTGCALRQGLRRKTACPFLSWRIGAALVLQNQGFEVLDFPEDPFLQFFNAASCLTRQLRQEKVVSQSGRLFVILKPHCSVQSVL